MQRLSDLITQVAHIGGIPVDIMLQHRTKKAVICKQAISWIALRVYEYKVNIIASALGYAASRNIVSQACLKIENDIYTLYPPTLHILTEILCKEEKTTKEKTDGICSPSDLYNILLKSLPSGLQNTLRTHGKIYQTGTTATKRHSSVTSSNTSKDTYTTKKADSHTSHTLHGTPSFLYTSDIAWANREALRYDYATSQEQRQIYSALLSACVWGRKCDYENRKRKSELKDQDIYSSIID